MKFLSNFVHYTIWQWRSEHKTSIRFSEDKYSHVGLFAGGKHLPVQVNAEVRDV